MPEYSHLNASDLQQHSEFLWLDGFYLWLPDHYIHLRRFIRSLTDEGTVNRKTLMDAADNRERFHKKGGDSSPK